MRPSTTLAIAFSASGLFIASVVALMFTVYIDTPRAAPFNENFSLIDDEGPPGRQVDLQGAPVSHLRRLYPLPGGVPDDAL